MSNEKNIDMSNTLQEQELKGLKEMFIQATTKEEADELLIIIESLESEINK